MSLIYDAEEIRAWDAFTISNEPISSIDLMERAAEGCCKQLLGAYHFKTIAFVCGKGNNGGDGLAMARMLAGRDKTITLYICELSEVGSPDFEFNLERLPDTINVELLNKGEVPSLNHDLVVDCLFGSGLNRPVEGWLGKVIATVNNSNSLIISIDIPSGMFVGSNAENPLKHVIHASQTLTFQTPKFPFFFADYEKFTGKITVVDIGLLGNFRANSMATLLEKSTIKLNTTSNFSHKGTKGYLTIIGGTGNMIGAAMMAARAAFRTGCGYVGVVSNEKIVAPLATVLPEAIWAGEMPDKLPKKTTAIAIGPGLGQSDQSKQLLEMALTYQQPLVIDADALNLLSQSEELLEILPKGSILTPHLGELYRLIGKTNSPEALLKKQEAFSEKYGVYIIQKGAWSKLTGPEGEIFINPTGNHAMASAGMGDALTGMIGSFLAQGYSPVEAAKNGMYFHGLAGDLAVRDNGHHGLITSDVIEKIPTALNHI